MTTLDLSICYEELGFAEPPFRLTPDTDFFFAGLALCGSPQPPPIWHCQR